MYPRSKFQEILLEIRQEMAREADFDVDLFAEIVRTGVGPSDPRIHSLGDTTRPDQPSRGGRRRAASNDGR
jgi:hypothetical protein